MSCDQAQLAVRASGLGKCYHVYARPQDRLRQFFGRGRRFYREFWALRGVDLEVPSGMTLGIVGRNGAGKTTLLQLIAGTLQPSEGTVEARGRVTALLELGTGFHPDFSGRENVFLAGAVLGLDRAEMAARFEAIAEFAGIGEFIDRPVHTYSKGMFTRLAFALYANLDPDVFLVDEALAVGDPKFRHRCMYHFRQLQERGVTILYVSHDTDSMKRLCHEVAWIDGGELRQRGAPGPVVDAFLRDLFGIPRGGRASAPPFEPPAAPETAIESHDGREGDRRAEIVGVELYDDAGQPCRLFAGGSGAVLRVTCRNASLDPAGTTWVLGYRLRDHRGQEIAAYNTADDDLRLDAGAVGTVMTCRFRVVLPELQAGDYTFSVGLAYVTAAAPEPQIADRIENALLFRFTTQRRVPFVLRLDTRFEREVEAAAPAPGVLGADGLPARAAPPNWGEVPRDDVIAGLIRQDRRHLWVVAAPKTGSTWMSVLLERALGWRRIPLVAHYGRREQEVDTRWLMAHRDEDVFSPSQHCRASAATLDFIARFRVTVLLQVRDIFDSIASLRDHFARYGPEIPWAFVDESFLALPGERQLDVLVTLAAPWYFNFYAGWFSAMREVQGLCRVIRYEELRSDPASVLDGVLRHVGCPRDAEVVRRIVAGTGDADTRLNAARVGRGRELLTPRQIERIREYRAFYPDLDFSLIGLD